MSTDPQIDRLTELLTPVIEGAGFELVRLAMIGGKTAILQVMAEKPDGTMTANQCATLSRAISALLDEEDPIAGEYNLEVSSPGIDRPLTRLKDFDRWEGYQAKLELSQMIEGRKRFKGVLAGIEDDNICIDLEGEEDTALIPFNLLATAKLMLTDDLIRDTLRAAKAEGTVPDDMPSLVDEEKKAGASPSKKTT